MMAIKLNEAALIQEVVETISPQEVELAVQSLPQPYVHRTLKFMANSLESTRHVDFYLTWIQTLLTVHGPNLCGSNSNVMPILLTLQKNLTRRYDDLSKVCDFNKYTLMYLDRVGHLKIKAKEEEPEDMEMDFENIEDNLS